MANYTTPETGRARHYYRSVEGRRGTDRLFYEATVVAAKEKPWRACQHTPGLGLRGVSLGETPQVSGSLQSLLKTAEQVVVIVWLAQEANCSGLHCACPRGIVRKTRDENDGDAMTSGDQPMLQVNAAQARHLQIGDQARCVVDFRGFEKFVGRAKRGSVVAQRSHERFRRFAHAFIVIDNRNHRNNPDRSDNLHERTANFAVPSG